MSTGPDIQRTPIRGRGAPGRERRVDGAVEVTVRPQQPGRRGVPAVPVLQQRRLLAELVGGVEVPRGRVEVALLAQDVGKADVEVAGGFQVEVEAAVLGEELEHVVEETDAGRDLILPLAVEV